MALPRDPVPVLLVVAAFSKAESARAWGRARLEEAFGPVAVASPPLPFHQTRYYERSMGTDLRKQFLAFDRLVDAAELAPIKLHTNELERQLATSGTYAEERPLNLDPGILSLGKFMLATTKDQAHRIYLRDGIFAEVTLHFEQGAFVPWPWTYADYRELELHQFLQQAREEYRRRLSAWKHTRSNASAASDPMQGV